MSAEIEIELRVAPVGDRDRAKGEEEIGMTGICGNRVWRRFGPRWLSLSAMALAMAALASGSARGHDHDEDEAPAAVPLAEAYRPTGLPDRIILSFAGDPARTMGVNWRTSTSIAKGVAQIAVADAGPGFAARARTVTATSENLRTDLGEARYHSVVFEDLEPSTLYAYRVGDGVNWSEWIHARTASTEPEAFSFIYFGDAQNDVKSMWSRVIRGAYGDAPKARFIVHAGDLINRANRDAEWGEWFLAGGWLHAMVPCAPTPGNHEYERPEGQPMARPALSRHWRPQFTLPTNGPEGLEESAYYVDYQGLRLISLNSNEKQEEQAAWVDEVLSNNPNKWTAITFHHPIYSPAKDRDNPRLRNLWQPIFDKHRVDIVLQGHDHTYARTGLRAYENVATGAAARDSEGGGTMYVVSVSGPKMYGLKREPWMRRVAEDTQLYQIITIDGDTLSYEARTAVGELYDAFELRKREGASNELVEKVPDTPERVRSAAPGATGEGGGGR